MKCKYSVKYYNKIKKTKDGSLLAKKYVVLLWKQRTINIIFRSSFG